MLWRKFLELDLETKKKIGGVQFIIQIFSLSFQAKFVVNVDQVSNLTLGIHDSHGYIDSYYSMRGNNRIAFPSQILGAKVSREMRFEIA